MSLVLNWLWQGTLLALAATALLALLPRARGSARHLVWWIAMAAVLAVPIAPILGALTPSTPVSGLVDAAVAAPPILVPARWWTSDALLVVWCAAWSLTFTIRLVLASLAVRRARRRCRPFPAGVALRLPHWRHERGRGRRSSLALSDDVGSAAVFGVGAPVIAVAPDVVEALDARDLDRVVMHEWAHVQRRDDVARIVQAAVRALAGWHPAIWWIDRQLTLECEAACDEIAVERTGSARDYAACLAALAGLPALPRPGLAAPGMLAAPGLRHRVTRLLVRAPRLSRRSSAALVTAAALLLAVWSLVLGSHRVVGVSLPARAIHLLEPLAVIGRAVVVETHAGPLVPQRDPQARPDVLPAPAATGALPASFPPAAETMLSGPAGEPAIVPASTSDVPAEREDPIAAADVRVAIPLASAPIVDVPAFASLVAGSSAAPAADSPWRTASAGGVAVSRHSQRAATATAALFTRFGRKIAGAF